MAMTKEQWESNNKVLIANGIPPNPEPKGGFATSATPINPITTPIAQAKPVSTPSPSQYDFTATPQQNQAKGVNVSTTASGGTQVGAPTPVKPSPVTQATQATQQLAIPTKPKTENQINQIQQQPTQQPVQQPVQQPIQQPNNQVSEVRLRDFAQAIGQDINWNPTTGNIKMGDRTLTPAELQQLGFTNVSGRWTGDENKIASVFGLQQLRGTLEGMGIASDAIQFANGQLTINGVTVPADGMYNVNGRLYGSPQAIQNIINRTGGNVPIGQEFTTGQEGQLNQDGSNQFQDSINQLQESNQNLLDELEDQKVGFEQKLADYIDSSDNKIQAMLDGLKGYKDEYKAQFDSILSQMMQPFGYDPNTDAQLQDAYKYADAKIQADLIRRGMDDSSLSTSSKVELMRELMPKYQNLALERYNSNISKLIQQGNFVQGLSKEAFDRFSAYTTAAINSTDKMTDRTIKSFEKVIDDIADQQKNIINQEKNQIEGMNKIYERALDKLDKVGYVTNDIAPILGLEPNTPARVAKEFAIKRIDEYNKTNINFENELKKVEFTKELEKQKLKEEATIKNKSNAIITSISGMTSSQGFQYIADNAETLLEAGIDIEPINKYLVEKAKEEEAKRQKDIDNQNEAERLNISRRSAEDASARGWANVAISQQSEARQQRKEEQEQKINTGLEKEADKWLKSYEDSLKDETSPNGTPLDYYYYNSPESTQRADAFRGLNEWLNNSGASEDEAIQILVKKGFGNFLKKG